jgi:hypothetical protein
VTCGSAVIGMPVEVIIIVARVPIPIAATVVVVVAAGEALEQATQTGGPSAALRAVAVKEVAEDIKHWFSLLGPDGPVHHVVVPQPARRRAQVAASPSPTLGAGG